MGKSASSINIDDLMKKIEGLTKALEGNTNENVNLSNNINNLKSSIKKSSSSSTGSGKTPKPSAKNKDFKNLTNKQVDDLQGMGKRLSSKLGLSADGKMSSKLTKGLTGTVNKLGQTFAKFLPAVGWVLEGLELLGEGLNTYHKYTAALYRQQNAREQLQFDYSKKQFELETQLRVKQIETQGALQLKQFQLNAETLKEGKAIEFKAFATGLETALGPITKGINQTAYDAAAAAIDLSAAQTKLARHAGTREAQYGLFETQKKAELKSAEQLSAAEAQYNKVEAEYEKAKMTAEQSHELRELETSSIVGGIATGLRANESNEGTAVGNFNGKYAGDTLTGAEYDGLGQETMGGAIFRKIIGNEEGWFEANIEQLNVLGGQAMRSSQKNWTETQAHWDKTLAALEANVSLSEEQLNVTQDIADTATDTAAEMEKMWLNLAQTIDKYTDNFDKFTNSTAKNLGFTNLGQLRNYQGGMFSVVKEVGSKFGYDIEKFTKLQDSYISSTDRNKILSNRAYGNLVGLSEYLGGDDGLAAQYTSSMEIFNHGVDQSVDMLSEALDQVNKIGLNGRKYTKTVADNLKLAQKYNFKEGTKSIMDMAKWAQHTRFNMASLENMIANIHEGGLEGLITKAAGFQVLGGHAAMGADPLAMMFEAYADPQSLAKRYQAMTKGFGRFNRATGETEFNIGEQMQMEQIAKLQGRSVQEVRDEVQARHRRNQLQNIFGNKFNQDQIALLSNTSHYDTKTGTWKVGVNRGGKFEDIDVNSLTAGDFEKLMPKEHNERMEVYMGEIVTALQKVTGEEIREKADVAGATIASYFDSYNQRTMIAYNEFERHRTEYIEKVNAGRESATKAFDGFVKVWEKGNPEVEAQMANIQAASNNIKNALDETARIIGEANGKILGALTPVGAEGTGYATGFFGGLSSVYSDKMRELKNETTLSKSIRHYNQNYKGYNWQALAKKNTDNVNDAILQPNGRLIRPDKNDTSIFAKPDGPIGRALAPFQGNNNGPMRFEINGNLTLNSNGVGFNLIETIKKDPIALREFSRMLFVQLGDAKNGGRFKSETVIGSK